MLPDTADITSIILAGGRSRRFGSDKALQDVDGKSLIQRVIDCLSTFSTEVIIATADGKSITCTSAATVRTVADLMPGGGPLLGIHAGLTASTSSRAVVVGCDMPFLSAPLLRHMHRLGADHDAVVVRIGDKVEPLCAVYSRRCLSPIETLLGKNDLRVHELFDMVRVRYVEEDELDRFDPERLSLFNVNSRKDLDTARRLASGAS